MTVSININMQGLRGIATVNIPFTITANNFQGIVNEARSLKTDFEARFPDFVWNIQFPFHDVIFLDVDKPKKRKN